MELIADQVRAPGLQVVPGVALHAPQHHAAQAGEVLHAIGILHLVAGVALRHERLRLADAERREVAGHRAARTADADLDDGLAPHLVRAVEEDHLAWAEVAGDGRPARPAAVPAHGHVQVVGREAEAEVVLLRVGDTLGLHRRRELERPPVIARKVELGLRVGVADLVEAGRQHAVLDFSRAQGPPDEPGHGRPHERGRQRRAFSVCKGGGRRSEDEGESQNEDVLHGNLPFEI